MKKKERTGETILQNSSYLVNKTTTKTKEKRNENEGERGKHVQETGCKLSAVRLMEVLPAKDVDEYALGFKLTASSSVDSMLS